VVVKTVVLELSVWLEAVLVDDSVVAVVCCSPLQT